MGRDKAQLLVGGVAAATRAARLLAELFEEVLLVGGSPPADAPGRLVADPPGPRCALRGLVGALAAARSERVLAVATDLPLIQADLLLALVAWPEADAVVPHPSEGPQPLCALYRRETTLDAARRRLAVGQLAMRGLLEDLSVTYLDAEALAAVDPRGDAFTNVNTPGELERVERWLRSRQADSPAPSGSSAA
jgi:molybdopterin-guanine dinucleotide biosynthesis protein A